MPVPYLPTLHNVHLLSTVSPVDAPYLPAEHTPEHAAASEVCAALPPNFPCSHRVHAAALRPEAPDHRPAKHASHWLSALAAVVPGAIRSPWPHDVQAPALSAESADHVPLTQSWHWFGLDAPDTAVSIRFP